MAVLNNSVLLLCLVFFSVVLCNIQYVPANILIPTLNGSLVLVPVNGTAYNRVNNTAYNKANATATRVNSTRLPYYPYYGFNNNTYNNKNNKNSTYNGTEDGHLILGNIQSFDRLLFRQEYFKAGRWYSGRDKIIEYPKDLPAGYSRHETISAIKVLNQFYDGNHAKAEILAGGIGRQYVKIKLSSPWKYGFRYIVNIYGR